MRRQLLLIGYKFSIYIAISVFFFACFLGYVSNVSIDTLIEKAVIAGCLFGLVFFVSTKVLVKSFPKNIDVVEHKESNDDSKSETESDG